MGFKPFLLGALLPLTALALPNIQMRATDSTHLEFDCAADLQDVCANMCFGAFCQGTGTALIFDNPASTLRSARRRAAGCEPRPNRCSVKKGGIPGENCDEYPFASTDIQGATKTRVNRCVDKHENSRQGAALSNWGQRFCPTGSCNFNVAFANPNAATDFCPTVCTGPNPQGRNCNTPTGEQVGPGPFVKRDLPQSSAYEVRFWRLKSGREVMIRGLVGQNRVGEAVYRMKPINATLFEEQVHNHEAYLDSLSPEELEHMDDQYAYMLPNLDLERDEIAGHAIQKRDTCSYSEPAPSFTSSFPFSSSSLPVSSQPAPPPTTSSEPVVTSAPPPSSQPAPPPATSSQPPPPPATSSQPAVTPAPSSQPPPAPASSAFFASSSGFFF